MKYKVFVVHCSDYGDVPQKIDILLDMMGGLNQFIRSGERIVVKPNLLQVAAPEKAVTTHPSIVESVCKKVKALNDLAVIAESPGSGLSHSEGTFKKLYETCGMNEASQNSGVPLNWDTSHQVVSFGEGQLIKRFEILTPIAEADGVINLCKMKTHTFMGMTGAVKNNFGAIVGRSKPGYHAKLMDTRHFAGMLLDLADYVFPRFTIMDAVVGMEGNGPFAGSPKKIGYLLASESLLALDVVASEMMGLAFDKNPVLLEAKNRGMTPTSLDAIELVGASIDELRVQDFKMPDTFVSGLGFGAMPDWVVKLASALFKNGASMKPVVRQNDCVACGICKKACPKDAITILPQKYAHIDPDLCIRCYCCHEMCPEEAIDLRRHWMYRLIHH